MSNIIVRKGPSNKAFHPHYNHALGTYISTSRQYLSEMKRQGCEPYDPSKVVRRARKPYTPSKMAHEMIESVRHGHVGDVFKEQLRRMGARPMPKRLLAAYDKTGTGGFATDAEMRRD